MGDSEVRAAGGDDALFRSILSSKSSFQQVEPHQYLMGELTKLGVSYLPLLSFGKISSPAGSLSAQGGKEGKKTLLPLALLLLQEKSKTLPPAEIPEKQNDPVDNLSSSGTGVCG